MNGGVERCRASIPRILKSSSPATFPKYFGQRAGVARALRDERHPVVVGFVFEPNLDAFCDLRRERLEVLAVLVIDVGVRGHPDGVDDAVDDPSQPPASSRCFAVSRISRANALIAS